MPLRIGLFGDQKDNIAVVTVSLSPFFFFLYIFFGFVFINTLRLLAGPVTLFSAFYYIRLPGWILFDFFFLLIFGHFDVLFLCTFLGQDPLLLPLYF